MKMKTIKKYMKDENKPKKKKDRFEITEMFMAQCGKDKWSQCYYGVINREKDENGKEIAVNSHILLPHQGLIWARAENQKILGDLLDSMVEWRLKFCLHNDPGVNSEIAEQKFFHN